MWQYCRDTGEDSHTHTQTPSRIQHYKLSQSASGSGELDGNAILQGHRGQSHRTFITINRASRGYNMHGGPVTDLLSRCDKCRLNDTN